MCFSLSITNDQIPCERAAPDDTGINETHRKPRWCLQWDWERMTDCIKKGEVVDQVLSKKPACALAGWGGCDRSGGQIVILAEGCSRRGLRRCGWATYTPAEAPTRILELLKT